MSNTSSTESEVVEISPGIYTTADRAERQRDSKSVKFQVTTAEGSREKKNLKKENVSAVGGSVFTALTIISFFITGLSINAFPSGQTSVELGKDIDCYHQQFQIDAVSFYAALAGYANNTMDWTQSVITAASVVLPATPLLLNSKNMFNEGKLDALVAHALGQSASFGAMEMVRHFVIHPNMQFFSKCNLTLAECNHLNPGKYTLLSPDDNVTNSSRRALCSETTTVIKDLFNSLHSLPDLGSALVGSAAVIFVCNLWFWNLANKNNKTASSTHVITKIILIIVFLMYIILSMLYRLRRVENTMGELLFSFLCGAGIQVFIAFLYQFKKDQTDVSKKQYEMIPM
jgi:hypothetical protein